MKTLALLALAGLSSYAFAATPTDTAASAATQTERYHYGMPMDIARVIASSDVSRECGVVPATITFADHQGQVHEVEYLVLGSGCNDN